jgi:hypothetical protein
MDDPEIENLRRSMAMCPPDSPAPLTCRQAEQLIALLREARRRADDLG